MKKPKHYRDLPIQPQEFIYQNGLGFNEGSIIKRLCRHQSKDGVEDLMKAREEIDFLIQKHKEKCKTNNKTPRLRYIYRNLFGAP